MSNLLVLLTHLELPSSVRSWLAAHQVVEAVGALEILLKLKQLGLVDESGLDEMDIATSITLLENVLAELQIEIDTKAYSLPPLGVPSEVFIKSNDLDLQDNDQEGDND